MRPTVRWIAAGLFALATGGAALAPRALGADAEADCRGLRAEAKTLLVEADERNRPESALRAAALLERAERLCPGDPEDAYDLGLAFLLARDSDRARLALERLERTLRDRLAERGRPEAEARVDSRVLYLRARIHMTFGNNPQAAIDEVTRLRARDPEFLPGPVRSLEFRARIAYANQLAFANSFEEAVRQTRLAEEVVRGDQARQDIARRNLAQILRLADRWIESAEMFKELVDRYPRDAVLRYGYASVLADQYQWEAAAEQWEHVLKLAGEPGTVDAAEADQLSDARLRYGVTLCHQGKKQEGKTQVETYLKAHPGEARAWFQMGNVYYETLEDPDSAIPYLEKARAMDPWCERTLRTLFTIYTNDRPDEARAKVLKQTLDSEQDKAAREREMKRRRATRADGTSGCE